MLNRNFWRRLAARLTAVCVFSLAVSATGFAQQITCPIANPATNTSATATNSLNPCTIQPPLGFFTNAKTGTLENKSGAALINESQFTNDGTVLNDAGATLTNNASLTNAAGATLSNSGVFFGTGATQNYGTLNNLGSGGIINIIDNFGGTINNSGLSVYLASGSDIEGGTLKSSSGSIAGWGDNVTFDGSTAFGALTIQGAISNDISTNTTLHVQGTINNEGTIELGNGGFPVTATLSLGASTTLEGGGKVTLSGGAEIAGILAHSTFTNVNNTIQGFGELNLGPAVFNNQGTVNANVSGQTLLISGAPSNNSTNNTGVMEATGGGTLTFGGSGAIHNNAGGSIVTDASSTIINQAGIPLTNASGATISNAGTFTNNGTIMNYAGATVSNSGNFGGTGTIQNYGTLNNLGNGTINSVIDNFGGTVSNKGGLPVSLFSGSVIQGGTLNGGALGIIWENNVTLDGSTGYGALTTQGTVENDASVSTTLHVLGTINNEGTIQLNSAGLPTVATLSVDGNTTLQGGGKLNLLHEFITEGGSGSWTLTNVNNTIQGSAVITLGGFGNFVNQGTVNTNISGQELLIFGGLTTSPGVTEEITNSGVMEATGGATLTFDISGNVNNNSGGSIVAGAGSTINNESGVTLFNNAGAKISNAGTFNNNGTVFGGGAITNSGIWNNTGVLQSGGTLTNAAGGTLNNTGEIENLGTMNIAAGSSVTVVASGLLVPSGTLVNDGSLNNAGNLSLQSGGSLSSGPGATVQNSGVIGIDAESSFVSYGNVVNEKGATISNDGSFITKDGTTLDNYGAMVNGGPGAGAIMAIGGSLDNHAGSTFTNLGELVTDSQVINDFGAKLTTYGAMSIGNNLSNAGSLEIGAGGQISVGVGATLNNSGMFVNDAGGSILNYGSIVNDKGATFINDGSFVNKTGSSFVNDGTFTLGAGSSFTDGGSFTNTGTLNVAPGATLSNPNGFVQTGGQAVVDGTLNSMSVKILGGTFSGAGTVTGGVLNSGGIFQPGANGTPGTLVVEDYEQQSGATFDELIGAPGNGALVAVAGGIQLDQGALLDIDLLNGFKPTDGETFDIMGAIQISGTFANAPTTGFQMDGFDWTITYDPGGIVLDAVSPVSSGGANTPEPPSFLLFVPSLAALAFLRRRTKELRA